MCGSVFKEEKLTDVIAQATTSFGVHPVAVEVDALQGIAGEARRYQVVMSGGKKKVESLTDVEGPARGLREVIGKTTTALVAAAGDPRDYRCSSTAYRSLLA